MRSEQRMWVAWYKLNALLSLCLCFDVLQVLKGSRAASSWRETVDVPTASIPMTCRSSRVASGRRGSVSRESLVLSCMDTIQGSCQFNQYLAYLSMAESLHRWCQKYVCRSCPCLFHDVDVSSNCYLAHIRFVDVQIFSV